MNSGNLAIFVTHFLSNRSKITSRLNCEVYQMFWKRRSTVLPSFGQWLRKVKLRESSQYSKLKSDLYKRQNNHCNNNFFLMTIVLSKNSHLAVFLCTSFKRFVISSFMLCCGPLLSLRLYIPALTRHTNYVSGLSILYSTKLRTVCSSEHRFHKTNSFISITF